MAAAGGGFSASARMEVDLRIERPRYVYEGLPWSGVSLQLYGMFHDLSSIPNVCRRIAVGLDGAVPALAVHSYIDQPFVAGGVAAHQGVDPGAPIGLFYGIPEAVKPPVLEHATRVIGLACETDLIPPRWVDCCNRFDLAFVPSRYCRETLLRSGVRVPVMVVPHGVEACYRPTRAKARDERFVFYNVINADRPGRKGLLELLRAFRRAFQGRSDVVLRLRTQTSLQVRRTFADARVARDDPLIEIAPRTDLPTEAFAAAYSEVHCTVHPSRAEGFGLIPLQSIACETPVIAPASTGMADYLSEDNAMLLRTRGVSTRPDVYYGYGSHPLIDEDHLVELLRYAEAHWETEYARVCSVAGTMRSRYTWESSLSGLARLVGELARIDDPEGRRAHIERFVGETQPS